LKESGLNIYTEDIKDLNDLVMKCYELKSPALKNIGNYFTDSKLDALYI